MSEVCCLERAWINQPLTHQNHHNLHGKKVLVFFPYDVKNNLAFVYFTDGPVISSVLHANALSKGWNK
jgi:hypothetical protein